jgi:hypothetical protein
MDDVGRLSATDTGAQARAVALLLRLARELECTLQRSIYDKVLPYEVGVMWWTHLRGYQGSVGPRWCLSTMRLHLQPSAILRARVGGQSVLGVGKTWVVNPPCTRPRLGWAQISVKQCGGKWSRARVVIASPLWNDGYYTGSRRRILGKARIHKYIHKNHNNSALNVKLLQILRFEFDTSEFMQWNLTISGSDTLDDTRAITCPKMLPSAAINTYSASQYGVQPSGVWTSHW